MASFRVGLDLGAYPLQVGGLVLGKYLVVNGTKDVKVNGEEPPSKEDVVQALEDVRECVKAIFEAPDFSFAVVVVPNSTSSKNREAILSIARGAGFKVVKVVGENIAVANAYGDTVRDAVNKRIAIVSDKAGVLDISVVTVRPTGEARKDESYLRRDHVTGLFMRPGEFEAHKKHGPGDLIGDVAGAVEDIVEVPLEILNNIFFSPKFRDAAVDEVVLLGETSKSWKVRDAVERRYPTATVWEKINAYDMAAYGAAVIACTDSPIAVEETAHAYRGANGDLKYDETELPAED